MTFSFLHNTTFLVAVAVAVAAVAAVAVAAAAAVAVAVAVCLFSNQVASANYKRGQPDKIYKNQQYTCIQLCNQTITCT